MSRSTKTFLTKKGEKEQGQLAGLCTARATVPGRPVDQKPHPQHTYALQSERGRPRPPPSIRTTYLFFRPCLRNQALLNGQSLGSLQRRAFTGLFSMYRTVFQ